MLDFVIANVRVEVSDWSSQMRIDSTIGLHVNYFNIKNSHWEPIVEPWQCIFNVKNNYTRKCIDDLYYR